MPRKSLEYKKGQLKKVRRKNPPGTAPMPMELTDEVGAGHNAESDDQLFAVAGVPKLNQLE